MPKKGPKIKVPPTAGQIRKMLEEEQAKPPKKKRTRTLAQKTIATAMMVAEGKTQQQVAEAMGVSQQAVSLAVRQVNSVIPGYDLDDVLAMRRQSESRLDVYKRKLLAIVGIRDHEDPNARRPPPVPMNTADRHVTAEEWDAYKALCHDQGFDINGNPNGYCAKAAEEISGIKALVQIEVRRARLHGIDVPKRIEQLILKNVVHMGSAELMAEFEAAGMQLPPGWKDAIKARIKDPSAPNPRPVIDPDNPIGLRSNG